MLEEAAVLQFGLARGILPQLVDDQPAVAIELVGALGLPRQLRRMRHARMLTHEFLVLLPLRRPPRGIVAGTGLRAEYQRHAHRLEPLDVRFNLVNGIQVVELAVDDVERHIHEIVAVHLAVGAILRTADHGDAAIERQVRRPQRGLLQRHVVDAGAAVGNAGEVDVRLVDVVLALQRVDSAQDVVDLFLVPPLRRGPAARMQVDLLLALNAIGRASGRGHT